MNINLWDHKFCPGLPKEGQPRIPQTKNHRGTGYDIDGKCQSWEAWNFVESMSQSSVVERHVPLFSLPVDPPEVKNSKVTEKVTGPQAWKPDRFPNQHLMGASPGELEKNFRGP